MRHLQTRPSSLYSYIHVFILHLCIVVACNLVFSIIIRLERFVFCLSIGIRWEMDGLYMGICNGFILRAFLLINLLIGFYLYVCICVFVNVFFYYISLFFFFWGFFFLFTKKISTDTGLQKPVRRYRRLSVSALSPLIRWSTCLSFHMSIC